MKKIVASLVLFLSCGFALAQANSNVFSAVSYTAASQTGTTWDFKQYSINSLPVAYASGTIEVTGISLTTATITCLASTNSTDFTAVNLSPLLTPNTTATTETVTTSPTYYQFLLAGFISMKCNTTSGTFTATSISIQLTASPNALIGRVNSGGNPGGSAGGDLSGTYPNPTVTRLNGGATPTNCSSNQAPTGINGSGVAQNCTTYVLPNANGTTACIAGTQNNTPCLVLKIPLTNTSVTGFTTFTNLVTFGGAGLFQACEQQTIMTAGSTGTYQLGLFYVNGGNQNSPGLGGSVSVTTQWNTQNACITFAGDASTTVGYYISPISITGSGVDQYSINITRLQ